MSNGNPIVLLEGLDDVVALVGASETSTVEPAGDGHELSGPFSLRVKALGKTFVSEAVPFGSGNAKAATDGRPTSALSRASCGTAMSRTDVNRSSSRPTSTCSRITSG